MIKRSQERMEVTCIDAKMTNHKCYNVGGGVESTEPRPGAAQMPNPAHHIQSRTRTKER